MDQSRQISDEHYIETRDERVVDMDPVTLEHTELVVVCEGRAIHCHNHEETEISAGDVFVVRVGETSGYADCRSLRTYSVLFDAERLGLASLSVTHLPGLYTLFILDAEANDEEFDPRLRLDDKQLRRTRGIIDELREELEARNQGYKMVTQHLLLFLIGKLGRWYNQQPHEGGTKDPRISRSIIFMEQRFYETLTVEALAKRVNMSERAYYRAFQQVTGVSPNQYLNSLRLSQACDLLKHSRMTVTEIALECGFQSGSYLSRLFNKHLEMTPMAYRKLNRA